VQVEELLRRLALNDEEAVRRIVSSTRPFGPAGALEAKTSALVRLAALLSAGAATASFRATVECAHAAGATDEEIVGVLVEVAPVVGAARLVAAAPLLALAIDYDVESADDAWEGP
jgi:alkylhydroperoxidase/carboxymuconolactone decarboxylase family protein YurZ